MRSPKKFLVLLLIGSLSLVGVTALPAQAGGPKAVYLTWVSIANWLFEVGDLRILMDGYITRIPLAAFNGPGPDLINRLETTVGPLTWDVRTIRRIIDAIDADKLKNKKKNIDYILTGHSHFDHSWDTATWARETGAHIIGSRSTCFQAFAQGVSPSDCTIVSGGETLRLNEDVTVRVVRWNHSGDFGSVLHEPRELNLIPTPDPATGGLRGGILEDFPNGGGGRAFLFTVDTKEGDPITWFYTDTGSAAEIDHPVVVEGEGSFGVPLDNLKAALADAGFTSLDLWISLGGAPLAERVVPILHPRAYIPHHWDGLFEPFLAGLPFPNADPALDVFATSQGIQILRQHQYMDKFKLTADGIQPVRNRRVKERLGFSEVQTFPRP